MLFCLFLENKKRKEKQKTQPNPTPKKCCTLLQNINTIVLQAGGARGALPSAGDFSGSPGDAASQQDRGPPPDAEMPPAARPSFTSFQNLSALELPSENCQTSGAPWALRQLVGYAEPTESMGTEERTGVTWPTVRVILLFYFFFCLFFFSFFPL